MGLRVLQVKVGSYVSAETRDSEVTEETVFSLVHLVSVKYRHRFVSKGARPSGQSVSCSHAPGKDLISPVCLSVGSLTCSDVALTCRKLSIL